MTSIDRLLDELSKEKSALLVSLDGHQASFHLRYRSIDSVPKLLWNFREDHDFHSSQASKFSK